jgi:hypothetical protein
MMCGVAGALYVPQVGIINPGEMSPAASIEIAIWAAVGGRATLIGPIVGAFFVNGAKSWFTQAFPEFWLFFLGALFIAVTLFLPNGMVGLLRARRTRHDARPDEEAERLAAWQQKKHAQAPAAATAAPPARGHRRARLRPRRGAVPGRDHGQLRRLQGAEQAVADHQRGRAALHHRPQRRRQDDDDGLHHRQDPARQRHLLLRQHHRPAAPERDRHRADRRRPQVPEAHGVRAAQRVREPRARAALPTAACAPRCSAA